MVGDHVARFQKNDLVFLGPFLPHQWVCDIVDDNISDGLQNEAFVIQFGYEFLGNKFFDVPENASLKRCLKESSRGYEIVGESKSQIISVLHKMLNMRDVQRFYALFTIFEILGSMTEYHYLASPNSYDELSLKENEPLQLAIHYILQNFQKRIQIAELLTLTNMSYASFYPAFKKAYLMPFKDYLLNVRIGYACKLLTEKSMRISEIAYDSGFENISNFNRQFKKIKNITPRQFKKQYGNS